jgi:Y-X(10)_GDL-associated radical SAM protein
MEAPARYLNTEDVLENRPVHAVWEITLACDLKCRHCGSRAGKRRPDELSTAECLEVVTHLARLGTREVTLIGGEAYLRKDWTTIVKAITDAGMMCTIQTGGRNLTNQRIREAAAAGLQGAGVSIDGLRDLHDNLRGVRGSFDAAINALQRLTEHGLTTSVNTQITGPVISQLRRLLELFIEAHVKNWQVQLTVAMGRAADNPELLIQPFQVLELMPLLAELYQEAMPRGLLLQPGNNIGYFGPYESLLRGSGDEVFHWTSCTAGRNAIGIEADGTIKGCPSLPTSSYAGGNIRDRPVTDIWKLTPELSFARTRTRDELWGFCRTCYYSEVCLGGCTWTAHSLLSRRGNNPYCHHRALELAKHGLRERIEQVERAPGQSFDHGRFELILETRDGNRVESSESAPDHKDAASTPTSTMHVSTDSEQPRKLGQTCKLPFLELCRGCNRHIFPGTETCPHCGGDVWQLAQAYELNFTTARQAHKRLLALLQANSLASNQDIELLD